VVVFLGIHKKEVGNTKGYDKDNQELAARVVSQSGGEMRGACLLSRRSEDVSIFFGRSECSL
jgi:hypothetical protein